MKRGVYQQSPWHPEKKGENRRERNWGGFVKVVQLGGLNRLSIYN
jgi:hypothetical protein